MKTIKLILLAMMVGLSCFGANEGKAQFSKIKANQYVVTNEVDSVFTEWTKLVNIAFPNADTNGTTVTLGGKSLYDTFVTRNELKEIEFKEMSIDELFVNGWSLAVTNNVMYIGGKPIEPSTLNGIKEKAQETIDAINDETKTPDLQSIKKVMVEFLKVFTK